MLLSQVEVNVPLVEPALVFSPYSRLLTLELQVGEPLGTRLTIVCVPFIHPEPIDCAECLERVAPVSCCVHGQALLQVVTQIPVKCQYKQRAVGIAHDSSVQFAHDDGLEEMVCSGCKDMVS